MRSRSPGVKGQRVSVSQDLTDGRVRARGRLIFPSDSEDEDMEQTSLPGPVKLEMPEMPLASREKASNTLKVMAYCLMCQYNLTP